MPTSVFTKLSGVCKVVNLNHVEHSLGFPTIRTYSGGTARVVFISGFSPLFARMQVPNWPAWHGPGDSGWDALSNMMPL